MKPLLLGVVLLVLTVGTGGADTQENTPSNNLDQKPFNKTSDVYQDTREEEESSYSLVDKEQFKARKALLKMLQGLLNIVDEDRDAGAFSDFENPLERKLEEEPVMLGQVLHTTQRDRKAPCKNFFWKTFTAC